MARHASIKILIAYDAFEEFAAIVRPQEMAVVEDTTGLNEIINAVCLPRVHNNRPVNDHPCWSAEEVEDANHVNASSTK